jgi:ribosomal protein S18 acetylase RimI-like enzyme
MGDSESYILLKAWLRDDDFLRPPRENKGRTVSQAKPMGTRRPREIWGVREGEHMRGLVLLDFYPRVQGAELTLVVGPEFRRRGFGKFLLENARLHALALGLAFLEVSVDEANQGAWLLFEGQGYSYRVGANLGMRNLCLQLGERG